MSVSLRSVSHPRGHVDALTQSLYQVLHQRLHAGLSLCGEITLHIQLTQSLAHGALHSARHTLPARTVLLAAAHQLAVELKVGIHEIIAQIASGAADLVPGHVSLHSLHVGIHQHLVHLGEILRLRNVETLHAIHDAHRLEVTLPVDIRGKSNGLLHSVAVERTLRVAVLKLRIHSLSQTGLESHHHLGQLLSLLAAHLVVTGHSELLGHQLHITLADILVVALVQQVVVAVTKTQTTLVRPCNAHLGVILVGLAEHTEQHRVATLVHLQQLGPHILAGLHAVDLLKIRHQRGDTLLLQADAVHADVVHLRDLVGQRASGILILAHRIDDVVNILQSVLRQHIESTVARVLRIQRVPSHPAAAGELVEIVLKTGRSVEIVKVNTRAQLGLVLTTSSDNCHSSNA